jgi:hypothetical protein
MSKWMLNNKSNSLRNTTDCSVERKILQKRKGINFTIMRIPHLDIKCSHHVTNLRKKYKRQFTRILVRNRYLEENIRG